MGTIIQDYGPIYGEVVNGTVQGRPNGSVYIPLSNTISIRLLGSNALTGDGVSYKVTGGIAGVAESQDLASYMKYSLYSDAACTTQIGTSLNVPAGNFNESFRSTISYGSTSLVSGNDYYLRAQLINNGVAVATSSVITVVAS